MAAEDNDTKPQKKSLLGRDIDMLTIAVKRAATLGAVLGFLCHHLNCLGG